MKAYTDTREALAWQPTTLGLLHLTRVLVATFAGVEAAVGVGIGVPVHTPPRDKVPDCSRPYPDVRHRTCSTIDWRTCSQTRVAFPSGSQTSCVTVPRSISQLLSSATLWGPSVDGWAHGLEVFFFSFL